MDFNNSPGKQGSFRRDDTPHDRAAFQTKQKNNETKHQFMVIYIVNKMIAHIPKKSCIKGSFLQTRSCFPKVTPSIFLPNISERSQRCHLTEQKNRISINP